MNPLLVGEQATVNIILRHGVEVILIDGGRTRHPLKAQLGETRNDQVPAGSAPRTSTQAQAVDFLIPTADLPCAITREITIEFAGQLHRPVSMNGEGEIRRSRFGLITRIHTAVTGKVQET